MRDYRLLAAAALLLAGCGADETVAGNGANAVAALPASIPPPRAVPVPAPKPVKGDKIPAAFHGVYDSSDEACGRPSDGRLTVSAGELRFHESVGSVLGVIADPSGAIRVEADYQGEGERWRSSRELLLWADGTRLTITGDGTRMVRVRCPGAA